VVAGVGGLIIGHILWLVAISVAIATHDVARSVLLLSAGIGAVTVVAVMVGWLLYRRRSRVWAAFLWSLPISPVLLSICVLGVTYL
jgi:hypothetical protein